MQLECLRQGLGCVALSELCTEMTGSLQAAFPPAPALRLRLDLHHCKQEEVLVLEDDMEVLRMPTRSLLGSAPGNWGALQLYMLGHAADELYSAPPAAWVLWRPGIFNTGAYLINRAGMRRVRLRFQACPCVWPVCCWLARYFLTALSLSASVAAGGLACYCQLGLSTRLAAGH